MSKPTPIEEKHYGALVGKTITAIRWESCEGQALPILMFDDGTSACVMCDPEGNGVGFLDISSGKCLVLSPDSIPIQPEPFNSEEGARLALHDWILSFKPQGFYTTADGERISLHRLAGRCTIQFI